MFTFIKRLFSRSSVKRSGSSGLVHTRLVMPRSPASRLVVPRPVAPRPVVSRPVVAQSESPSFKRLSGACFGDRSKAESLIKYEHSRASGLSRDNAVQRAYERLMDDRR